MFCRASVEMMSLRLDGLLEPQDSLRLDTHIQGCEVCRAEWTALREADNLLRLSSRRPLAPPAGFSSHVMSRVAVTPAVRPPLWERERTKVAGGRPTVHLLHNLHPMQGRRMRLYIGGLSALGVLSMLLLSLAGLLWPAGGSLLPASAAGTLAANPSLQAVGDWFGSNWSLLRGLINGIDPLLAAVGTLVVSALGAAWWRIVGLVARRAGGREIAT